MQASILGDAAIQGSYRKMVAWVRMTMSPDLKSIGLVWNSVQAVMGLHVMPLWLKIKIVSVACLCSLSFRFSRFQFSLCSAPLPMSLSEFCDDVNKADRFKERAMKVFTINEIFDVCDLQWTTAAKMETAAVQAAIMGQSAPVQVQLVDEAPRPKPELWSYGVGAFIQRVFAKEATVREADARMTVRAQEAPEGSMSEQLSMHGGPAKVPKVFVNLNTVVNGDPANGKAALGLAGLDLQQWPKAELVDTMATEVARLKARGVEKPFVYTDVAQFLPGWCPKASRVEEQESVEEVENMMGKGFRLMAERLGAAKNVKQRLDVLRWIVAFDPYAIALSATGQLSYGKAMEHKALCQKVALEANEGRRGGLGVVYDEVARKAWEARARSGCTFDIESVAGKLEDTLLHDAKRVYDAAGKLAADEASRKLKGANGAGAFNCHTCGKSGHKSHDCWLNAKGASKGAGGSKGAGKAAGSAATKGKGKVAHCYTCGMIGHKSDTCPNAAFHMVNDLV